MTGPGVFDMKAGVVQLLEAASRLDHRDGIWVLLTSDEEIGSPTAQPLIAEAITGAAAALVFEPSSDGAVKTARKGVSHYTVRVTGRAAHAGLEPERGINAAIEAAHQVLAISALANPGAGTTVTPTVVSAGTAANVVLATASVAVDVRAATVPEQDRVEAALRGLGPALAGATLALEPGMRVPPLEAESSRGLFALAQRAAAEVGLPPLRGVQVGGGSDGNFTAAQGVPTLDGLGAVGGNAHAEGEWASVAALPERTALATELIRMILLPGAGLIPAAACRWGGLPAGTVVWGHKSTGLTSDGGTMSRTAPGRNRGSVRSSTTASTDGAASQARADADAAARASGVSVRESSRSPSIWPPSACCQRSGQHRGTEPPLPAHVTRTLWLSAATPRAPTERRGYGAAAGFLTAQTSGLGRARPALPQSAYPRPRAAATLEFAPTSNSAAGGRGRWLRGIDASPGP